MEQNQNPSRSPRRRTPFQRNRRLQGQLLSYLLVGCTVLFVVLGVITPDKDFSESENRSLAQLPGLESIKGGTFLNDLGSYVADQFPGRDSWMTLNLTMNTLLGQKEASGVYLGEDDYLLQVPGEPNETQLQRNLAAINTFTDAHPELNTVMAVIPNAVTIHSDKLPANAPVRDQRADLKNIQNALTGANFVDVTKTLEEHRDEYLFYKTDHHWTSLGAYYAFQNIGPLIGITTVPTLEDYVIYPVSTTFEGTLSSKSGSHSAKDTVDIYVPHSDIQYYVTYASGEEIGSLYNRAALDQKDHYTVFFGGNYSRVDITTSANTKRSLLILKDSYANCMIQFLFPYFDHITMVDPRYYYDNLELAIKTESVTDVLLLYNADTFLGDTSLADVLAANE